MTHRVIAHIDMDAFFAAVEQRNDPRLKGQPVVVGADPKEGRGRGVVATCSYEARKFGIRSAQPISEAWRRCPQAVFVRGNYEAYSQESRVIKKIFEEFTPDIESISIDEAFLDLSGCYHFYQTPERTASAIKQRVYSQTGLIASIGVAPVKFVAKIASDFCKPDGLLVIAPQKVLSFLHPLAIEKLWGVGRKTQAILNQLGIRTIGDLAIFSRTKLVETLGASAGHLCDLANGIDPRPVEADESVGSVSHEYTFDKDEQNPEEVLKVLMTLTEKVSRRLRKNGLKGRTVSIKIRTQGFVTNTRSETLPRAVNLIDAIYPVARDLFQKFIQEQTGEMNRGVESNRSGICVRLIGVKVSRFEDDYVVDSLFADSCHVRQEYIQTAMDKIKDKFGEQAIRRGF